MEKQNITEVKIQVPSNMCIDEENSTFECIKFKPKELTYKDIQNKICYTGRDITGWPEDEDFEKTIGLVIRPSNCPTLKQMKRLTAINQLMNVAYYFNEIVDKDVWSTYRFHLCTEKGGRVSCWRELSPFTANGLVYFKTEESAKKAIKILGEETVKLAISL